MEQTRNFISRMTTQVLNFILAFGFLQLAVSTPTQIANNQATFSSKLFSTIAQGKTHQNLVISPASVQTCLALAYTGAEGTTADELRRGLHLGSADLSKAQVAQQFGDLLTKMQSSDEAKVRMANRIYVKEGLQIAQEFNDVAKRYFESGAENVNFADGDGTARQINDWVEGQTEGKIKNLISPNGLGDDTAAILVNAIYFKAKWWNIFDSDDTAKKDFRLSTTETKRVDMMYQQDGFAYAELADFDAKAIAMRYVGTNIRMLVLLPNTLDGLGQLEAQLKDVDLTKILNRLKGEEVRVSLPKFKIEFDIELKPTLETLGMHDLFSSAADFSGMFADKEAVAVSEVKHKAFIEVNEKGTEAAGGTALKMMFMSMPMYEVIYDFNADHPFYFALLDDKTVYFNGHVVDI